MKQRILDFFDEKEDFLILLHANADPDAVGSAIALKEYLISKGKRVGVDAESYNKPSKNLLKNLKENFEPISSKNIVILDTSSLTQLGKCKKYLEWAESVLVIDHHQNSKFKNLHSLILKEDRTSTAEIIYDILPEKNKKILFAIIAGIITDTGGFKYSNTKTFETVLEILKQEIKIEDAFNVLKEELDVPKKIAILKSFQRLKIYRINDKIIATTKVSSYESFVSNHLLNVADVVFVANLKQKRINAKTTLDLDLSEIMEKIEEIIKGEGGGHKKAAGAKGENIEEGLKECVKITKEILSKS